MKSSEENKSWLIPAVWFVLLLEAEFWFLLAGKWKQRKILFLKQGVCVPLDTELISSPDFKSPFLTQKSPVQEIFMSYIQGKTQNSSNTSTSAGASSSLELLWNSLRWWSVPWPNQELVHGKGDRNYSYQEAQQCEQGEEQGNLCWIKTAWNQPRWKSTIASRALEKKQTKNLQ